MRVSDLCVRRPGSGCGRVEPTKRTQSTRSVISGFPYVWYNCVTPRLLTFHCQFPRNFKIRVILHS